MTARQEPQKRHISHGNMSLLLCVMVYVAYAFATNLIDQYYISQAYSLESEAMVLTCFFGVIGGVSALYLGYSMSQYRRSFITQPWMKIASVVIVGHIASASILQTDQFRYILDGIQGISGANPYAISPEQHPDYHRIFWMQMINHPDFRSVYPPVAQLFFAISTLLNPFLWNQAFNITTLPTATEPWQVELGWKLLTGVFSVGLCYVLRKRDMLMVVLHPLYLVAVVGNAHVDIIFAFFLLVALKFARQGKHKISALLLGLSILAKWIPLLFVPFFLLHWAQASKKKFGADNFYRQGESTSLLARIRSSAGWGVPLIVLVVVVVPISIFFGVDSVTLNKVGIYRSVYGLFHERNGLLFEGGMFESLFLYVQNWYFFGFIHHVLLDIIRAFWGEWQASNYATYICFTMLSISLVYVFSLMLRHKIGLRLALFLAYGVFLGLSATLHPWYFVTFLLLGMPYYRVFLLSWVWPLLSLGAMAYYFSNSDPTVVRYCVYFVVSCCLVYDLRILCRHLGKISHDDRGSLALIH